MVSQAGLTGRGGAKLAACLLGVYFAVAACDGPIPTPPSAYVGGRVLLAPGAPLVGAHISVDQEDLYDPSGKVRRHVGDTVADSDGAFAHFSVGTVNGLILIDASGGIFDDPVSSARIQLDPETHIRAIYPLGIFGDNESMLVTPVHALVEARFHYDVTQVRDTRTALANAYRLVDAHFGNLKWETVTPADLTVPATSPTDEVRASFVLGGFDLLADEIRSASNSTAQVVNLITLLQAMEQDIGDHWLDGNDANNNAPGSGLQVGDCPPVPSTCQLSGNACQLGDCRALCDVYSNVYRSLLADSISRFIGPKSSPTVWNKTTLGSEDARVLTDGIARDTNPELFSPDACAETQHRAAPTIVWEIAPPDGALQGGSIAL